MRWEIQATGDWGEAEKLAADGWEPYAVTSTFASWENTRKGYTESETTVAYYFRRQRVNAADERSQPGTES